MDVPYETIKAISQRISSQTIENRRTLHKIPELELHLPETQAVIVAQLQRIGITNITLGKELTSVVADIQGTSTTAGTVRCVALRSDMDALPLTETNDCDFISTHTGRMHGMLFTVYSANFCSMWT